VHSVDEDLEDIARDVVAQFAPDELGLFDATVAALRGRTPKTARGGVDELLGFGIDVVESVITVAVLMGTKAAFDQFVQVAGTNAGTAAAGRAKRLLDRARHRPARAVPHTPVPLAEDQLAAVRAAAVKEIAAFGLPEERSAQIANAIIGRLAVPESPAPGGTP
jgi:hypothetical protein